MRFNKNIVAEPTLVNYEGRPAFNASEACGSEFELFMAVTTTLLADNYYEKADQRVARIVELSSNVSLEFLAKLCLYTRKVANLRSASTLLLALYIKQSHEPISALEAQDKTINTRKLICEMIVRADDITELMSAFAFVSGRTGIKKLNKLPNQLKAAICDVLNKSTAYSLAKYNRKGAVTFKDVIRLCHPKPKDEAQGLIFKKILTDNLESPNTWEVNLSDLGKKYTGEELKVKKAEFWRNAVTDNSLGYMALLRNLRNIFEGNNIKSLVKEVAKRLSDPEEVKRSKQLPFRFLSAFRELEGLVDYEILHALRVAAVTSIANLDMEFFGKTLLVSDVSGSMETNISKSKLEYKDIGVYLSNLFCTKLEMSDQIVFADRVDVFKGNSDIFNMKTPNVGGGTNIEKVFEYLLNGKSEYENVIIFTDLQFSNTNAKSITTFRKRHPNTTIYFWNLAGYNNVPERPSNNIVYLSGFSDQMICTLSLIKKGEKVLDHVFKDINLEIVK